MKTNKFGDTLAKVTTNFIGMLLRFCSIAIWVPASIALGVAEVLENVGELLTDCNKEVGTEEPEEEAVEVTEIATK